MDKSQFYSDTRADLPGQRWGNQFSIAAPVNSYVCTDGRVYTGVLLDSHWRTFCEHIDRTDIAGLNGMERILRREELDNVFARWCMTRSTREVVDTLNGLGLAVARVNSFAEAAQDPHVKARDMLQPISVAGGSEVPLTGPAAKFSRTPTRVRSAAPTLGEHTDVLLAHLGYTAAQIADLRDRRII